MSVTANISGAIIALTIGFTTVLPATQRTPPVDVLAFEVVTPIVEPGTNLLIRYTVNRHEVCRTTALATITDGSRIEYRVAPDERPAFGPEGEETRIVRYVIPEGAARGLATYRLVLDFRCNWTHDIAPVTMVLPDLGFIIGTPPAEG
jgi:hypothetical protein